MVRTVLVIGDDVPEERALKKRGLKTAERTYANPAYIESLKAENP